MKKVIISLVAVLGLASAAWAFTPSTKTETPAATHNHNHVHELNAEEGHQHNHEASVYIWQCQKCGKKANTRSSTSTPHTGHVSEDICSIDNTLHKWVLVGSVD